MLSSCGTGLITTASAEAPNATDKAQEDFVADPTTGQLAPKTIKLSDPATILDLVGLGVRTVSFLSIRVYVASFYMSPEALKALPEALQGTSYNASLLQKGNVEGEKLLSRILDQPAALAIRIDPTRATDFSHWRDAFIRSLSQRVSRFQKAGELEDGQADRAFEAMSELRSIFALGKAEKGKALLVVRRADGALDYIYEGKTIGTLSDPWVAKQMLLSYFSQPVISDQLQGSVAEGLRAALELHR